MDGANGQNGGKNRRSTFVLTAFISFGLFNIFLVSICVV
jgi:succinate-acetate transporter protein